MSFDKEDTTEDDDLQSPSVSVPPPQRPFIPDDFLLEENEVTEDKKRRDPLFKPAFFFLMTCFTALLAGAFQVGANPFKNPADLRLGIPFGGTLLLILFCHEMGHYLTAKRYGVDVTLPFFIPGPWMPLWMMGIPWYTIGIGTFGAFIRIKSPIFQRRALLDIGAAGPIAGFVVSIFAAAIGLYSSPIIKSPRGIFSIQFGEPLIFTLIENIMGKVPPEGYDIALNSMAFAGWIGFFITALNLLPIGQLDGGHILYALLGKKHRHLSMASIVILVMLGFNGWPGWFIWAILTAVLGVNHPPVMDGPVPLDFKHRMVALTSIIIFIVTFMPIPISVG